MTLWHVLLLLCAFLAISVPSGPCNTPMRASKMRRTRPIASHRLTQQQHKRLLETSPRLCSLPLVMAQDLPV